MCVCAYTLALAFVCHKKKINNKCNTIPKKNALYDTKPHNPPTQSKKNCTKIHLLPWLLPINTIHHQPFTICVSCMLNQLHQPQNSSKD